MARHLSLAVVGSDYPNKKGPGRRFEIALCNPGEPVALVPEPKNPVDSLAIGIFSCRGIQIGYVSAERAQLIGSAIKRAAARAIFQKKESWGATIRVSLDGSVPTLPDPRDSQGDVWPPPGSGDADWWPDEIPPD